MQKEMREILEGINCSVCGCRAAEHPEDTFHSKSVGIVVAQLTKLIVDGLEGMKPSWRKLS